jgi:hypothetical protein
MIIGCFLTLALIVTISLNPYLLTKNSIHKSPGNAQLIFEKYLFKNIVLIESIQNIPISVIGKSSIATNIIEQLDIFSHQVDCFRMNIFFPIIDNRLMSN